MNTKLNRSSCHERIADDLRTTVQSLPSGSRLDSIAKLAIHYEVSAVTVRLALALLQNEGWVILRHGSGCYVSRPATGTAHRHIAILSEFNLLQSEYGTRFHARVMDELRNFMEAKGLSSRLYIGHIEAEVSASENISCSEFMEDLDLDRINGVAALATLPFSILTDQVRIKQIPIVGMGGQHPGFSGTVDPDLPMAIDDALVRLVNNGRRRPAFIGWERGLGEHFMTAVAELGLIPNPSWIRSSQKPQNPGAGWSDFREIWAAGNEKPDCVIFVDDVLFRDAYPAIQSCGVQVPAGLEVVVLGNAGTPLPQPFAYTRMDCDPHEFAKEMGTMLLQLMAGEKPKKLQIAIPYRRVGQNVKRIKIGTMVRSQES